MKKGKEQNTDEFALKMGKGRHTDAATMKKLLKSDRAYRLQMAKSLGYDRIPKPDPKIAARLDGMLAHMKFTKNAVDMIKESRHRF